MANKKSTKRALMLSVVSLFICFTMLVGTTYAWFTDSVTSTGNIIKTGTLEVTLEYSETAPADKDAAEWKDASQVAIFDHDNWEPGYTEVRYVKVENEGSLDLRFVLTIVPNQQVADGEVDLADVIDVYIAKEVVAVDRALTGLTRVGTLADLIADPDGAAHGVLYADDDDNNTPVFEAYTIVLKMQETAGNEYQNISLGGGFSVNLLASQLASESDDIGTDYDTEATLPVVVGSGAVEVGTPNTLGDKYTIKAVAANTTDSQEVVYAATVVIPASAVATTAEQLVVTVVEDVPQTQSNLGINVAGEVKTYEVTVTGIKDGNTEDIEVYLYIGAGLDNVDGTVYHTLSDSSVEVISGTYDKYEGNVRFKTTSFSPFSVVLYDEPVEVVPGKPTATITNITANPPAGAYAWAFGGQDFQNAGIIYTLTPEDLPELDVLYDFTADQTPEEAAASEYADWDCDYYVMVDKDIAAESIALGGYYSQWGTWVAFTNLQPVEGGEWIPLLGMFGSWSYQDIVAGVGTFLCGVADYDESLAADDVTFTVQLRLTNPENANDYWVASEISYSFAAP